MESTGLAEQERVLASDWGGGKSPFGTSWSKFMMWIFIISDALTFAGFLIAYGFMRQVASGLAGADADLRPDTDHVHDVRPHQQQRRDGHGGQRGPRGGSESSDHGFWP